MKLERSRFEYIIGKYNLKHRMFKIENDKYIYLYSFKTFMLSIYRFGEIVVLLPIRLILAIMSAVWDCISDFPNYIKDFWERLKDLSPIRYIKVVDNYSEKSIK